MLPLRLDNTQDEAMLESSAFFGIPLHSHLPHPLARNKQSLWSLSHAELNDDVDESFIGVGMGSSSTQVIT